MPTLAVEGGGGVVAGAGIGVTVDGAGDAVAVGSATRTWDADDGVGDTVRDSGSDDCGSVPPQAAIATKSMAARRLCITLLILDPPRLYHPGDRIARPRRILTHRQVGQRVKW